MVLLIAFLVELMNKAAVVTHLKLHHLNILNQHVGECTIDYYNVHILLFCSFSVGDSCLLKDCLIVQYLVFNFVKVVNRSYNTV